MAQGQLATMPSAAVPTPAVGFSKDNLYQILQCERITQFRDAILAGTHPKIKLPAHLAKQALVSAIPSSSSPPSPAKEPTGSNAKASKPGILQSLASNTQHASLPGLGNPLPTNANLPTRPYGSGNTEINPIFLEKSDDLIKAEIQLQRQRLERALRDEVEQRRASMKASAQSEPLADFDLSDVLSKALTLVQATAPSSVNTTLAANISAASDSFDENSYYSSQHNSPDSSLRSSRAGHDSDLAVQACKTSVPDNSFARQTQTQVQTNEISQSGLPSHRHASATQPQGQAPTATTSHIRSVPSGAGSLQVNRCPSVGAIQRTEGGETACESTSGGGSGNASRSEELGIMELDDSADRSVSAADHRLRDTLLARQPSPLIHRQVEDIFPLQDQPAHISPLATTRGQAVDARDMSIPQGTTAQVVALRNEPNIVSSPDSSPQGGRNGEKRKGKKKKNNQNLNNRRAARQAPEEPYIKPEPRSPSPMSAPSFVRPQKRQRRQAEEQARYAQPERQFSRSYRDEGAAPAHETQEYRPRPASQTILTGDYRYGREYADETGVPSGAAYVRRVQSPGVYAVRTVPSEVYAPTPTSVDRYGREPTRYDRDGYEVTRISARPLPDRGRSRSPVMRKRASPLMGPPKASGTRVVIDPLSGRRFYEPSSVVRQSVGPPPRPGESEIIYERALTRAESRRPGPDLHDNDVLYQGTSPMYSAPRRVVTQPDYTLPDHHRMYRQREYSTRPMPPPGEEYIQVSSGTQRRVVEEVPREYIRATTARPTDTARYELPPREYGRVQSVRPEQLPCQDYTATTTPIHPDARHEVIQPGTRAYSVRPGAAEPHIVRREYSTHMRPIDQEYYGHPVPARGEAEVSYIERPRMATTEVYYAEEGPRQVYQ